MAIKIKQIFDSDTLLEVIDKLNFNFDQVVLNGGGLRGFQGLQGDQGVTGSTGRSGSQIHTGTYPPLNDAASLQVIKDNILNLQIGDYFLYLGESSLVDGYNLGDMYKVVESSGFIPGFSDFELQFQGNIRGPQGSDAATIGQIPSYISSENERFTKRNTGNTSFDIPLRPIPRIKPMMPQDTRLNIQNTDLLNSDAEPYLNDNPSTIILFESFKTLDLGGQPFGTEGVSLDFLIEDPEFNELGLTTAQILQSRKATLKYSYSQVDLAYVLNIRNDYESDGAGSGFPALTGNILMESSRKGNLELNYGTNFLLDINDDLYGDEPGYNGEMRFRAKRQINLQNIVAGNSPANEFININHQNLNISNSSPSAETTWSDRYIYNRVLPQGSPSQSILSAPSEIRHETDYLRQVAPSGTGYDYLVNRMVKGSSANNIILDTAGTNNFVVFKSSRNRLNTIGVDSNPLETDEYWLMHSLNSGDVFIKGGRNVSSSERRSTKYQFEGDFLRLTRTSQTAGGLSGNSSGRVPYIEWRNAADERALLLGWGSNNTVGDKYLEFRMGDTYDLWFTETNHAGFKVGFDSNPLTQHQRYTFNDGNVLITNNTVNQNVNRGLYLTESNTDQTGFRATYNSSNNYFRIQASNSANGSTWTDALGIRRDNQNVGIKMNPADANLDLTIGRSNVGLVDDGTNLIVQQNNTSGGATIIRSIGSVQIDLDQNNNQTAEYLLVTRNGSQPLWRTVENTSGSLTGRGEGTIHIVGNPSNATSATYTRGITFGHGDDGTAAQGGMAGVIVDSSSSGTRINLMTSNNFGSGRNHRVAIDWNGNIDMVDGNTLTIGKAGGADSYIRFDANGNDPGYIRHNEVSNASRMEFVVSDDAATNDLYVWKGSDEADAMRLDTLGNFYLRGSISLDGDLDIGGTGNNQARIFTETDQAGSPYIVFTENGDMTWSVGGDDNDNSFKIHGRADASHTNLNNFAEPHFEIDTGGITYIRNNHLRITQANTGILRASSEAGSRTGYFIGSHGGASGNGYGNQLDTNPYYTIGSGYRPNTRSLGNMYGTGYSNTAATFLASGSTSATSKFQADAWGEYVAADGDARIFLDATNGIVYGTHFRSLRSGGGDIRNIRSIAFNWTQYSYAVTEEYHGIESRDLDRNLTDSIAINSYNNVTIRLDSNNNNSSSELRVTKNVNSGGSNTLMLLRESGELYALRFTIGDTVDLARSGTGSKLLRAQSSDGYVEIGSSDATWARIQSDRPQFYFNQDVHITTRMTIYNTSTYLESANLRISTSGTNISGHRAGDVSVQSGNNRNKIRLWGQNDTNYTIGMDSAYTFGYLNDYAMTFQFNNDSDRGFWWGHSGHTKAQGAMSLTTNGNLYVGSRVDSDSIWNRGGQNRSNNAFAFLTNSGGAQQARVGSLLVSSSYSASNVSAIPSQGIYATGDINGDDLIFRNRLFNDSTSNVIIDDSENLTIAGNATVSGNVQGNNVIFVGGLYNDNTSNVIISDSENITITGDITCDDINADDLFVDMIYSNGAGGTTAYLDMNYPVSSTTNGKDPNEGLRLNMGYDGTLPFTSSNDDYMILTAGDILIASNDDVRIRHFGRDAVDAGPKEFDIENFDQIDIQCNTGQPNRIFINGGPADGSFSNVSLELQGWDDVKIRSATEDILFQTTSAKRMIYNNSVIHSDVRIKDEIEDISEFTNIRELYDSMAPKKYLKQGVFEYGFIAQEFEGVDNLHDLVYVKEGPSNYNDEEGNTIQDLRSINYESLHAVAIAGVKEVMKENDELKDENAKLKAEIEAIKKALKDNFDLDI